MDTETRNRILEEAKTWYGTRWHHQARVKGAGVDCAMYLCEVYEAVGLIPHVDPRPYPIDWALHNNQELFLDWLTKYARKVTVPQPGDAAVFKFGRTFSHGAIVKDWPIVLHCQRNEFVREQDATQGSLAGRDVRFYRIKKQMED
jgi:cell wall-associated NlpC family hydrolase